MTAHTVDYKRKAIKKLDVLSSDRLKVVLDFIEYLEQKEELDATLEILADQESMQNIRADDLSSCI
jgi:mRNA-degrading endonuclease RelE of RelBE toxin-antitoxin system